MGFFGKKTTPDRVIPSNVRDLEQNPYTEDEILAMAADILRAHYGAKIDKKSEEKLFEQLKEVEGFSDYLRDTAAADLQRHFVASTPIEQFNVRGAFARVIYWRGLLSRKKGDTTLKGQRYAK